MLPDRERDQLRVQAKNLVIELRREFEAEKAEGRDNATTTEESGATPSTDEGGGTQATTATTGGTSGGS